MVNINFNKMIKISIFALFFCSNLQASSAQGCEDNNNFQFGSYVSRGRQITRKCVWLKNNPQQIDNWCSRTYNGKAIGDKCQATCGTCRFNPGTCTDVSPRDQDPKNPNEWYDSVGSNYNCAWYAIGRNCAVYGSGFDNYELTAKEACCACGGGVNKAVRRAESVEDSSISEKQLRGTNVE